MIFNTFPMARPSSSKSLSLSLPSKRRSRDLSTDRMCSVRALVCAPMDCIEIRMGNRSGRGVVVNGTMTTVPRRWLIRVSERMAQGRVLACSWPRVGSSSVQYTSPRKCVDVMFDQLLRKLTRSMPPAQLQPPEKTFQRQSLGPNHRQAQTNLHPAILWFQPKKLGSRPHPRSSLRMQPPAPGLLCPTRDEQGRSETGYVAGAAQPAPTSQPHHQAGAVAPVWAGEFECLA